MTGRNVFSVNTQQVTGEGLQCPAISKWRDTGAGFASLIEVLATFQASWNIPHPLILARLDEEEGLPQTRVADQAWHNAEGSITWANLKGM
jgi:hypothetical protein